MGLAADNQLAPGQGAPTPRIGGVLTIEHNPDDLSGHWFILGRPNGTRGNGALLTPEQARLLSLKMDSPDPSVGRVRAKTGASPQGLCVTQDGQFDLRNKGIACVLYIQL